MAPSPSSSSPSSSSSPNTINPYKISIPDSKLHHLSQKLNTASFPDELDSSDWDYGAPLADVKRLTTYWREEYDWRKHESRMNELPNFVTAIQVDSGGGFESLDVHFVHRRSEVGNAIPLLFSHGWPGNFLEVSKLLPLLCAGGEDAPAFHVVAPSLPNFGFSSGTKKKGFGIRQYAETFHRLMLRLGYSSYGWSDPFSFLFSGLVVVIKASFIHYDPDPDILNGWHPVTQGGDWGFWITRAMGLLYPDHVRASHINYLHSNPPSWTAHPLLALQHTITPYTAGDRAGRRRSQQFQQSGRGYSAEQSTKPQTIGYSLADSPVGLLAWIYEKLHDWTDNYPWTEDEILTWVSIYWFSTAGPAASCRIYYESSKDESFGHARLMQYIPRVKLGLARFPREIFVAPKTWGRTLGPVVHESFHESGGHFGAWERPEVLARDLKEMFGKGGGAYGVVDGKNGYL